MSTEAYEQLFALSRKIRTFGSIHSLLFWDRETHMPSAAAQARSEQISAMSEYIHSQQTGRAFAKALGKLIDLETGELQQNSLSAAQKVAVRDWHREWRLVKALPPRFVKEWATTSSQALQPWMAARDADAFGRFAPYLDRIVRMCRHKTELIGYEEHPYDALLESYEPHSTKADLDRLFRDLPKQVGRLLENAQKKKTSDRKFLQRPLSDAKQLQLAKNLLEAIGYPFDRGSINTSIHPFSLGIHPTDNRLTTFIKRKNPISCLSATLHEAGHSFYELGLPLETWGSPLGQAISHGVHESQSRWWECWIGLSKPFWKWFFPQLKKAMGTSWDGIGLERFYRAINVCEPSLIRVEADELTYGLHILIRYELETQLLEGKLQVRDLPDAWNALYKKHLNLEPRNLKEGCLQDMHWAAGAFGYFPSYAIGNFVAAQLFESFEKDHADWDKRVSKGDFAFIRQWQKDKVHEHGRRYTRDELVRKVTGKRLSLKPYLKHLETKIDSL